MPSFLQWITSTAAKPKRYRIYVVYGEEAALRSDALDRIVRLTDPQERETLHVGYAEGEVSADRVWDAVEVQPLPSVSRRLVVVHHADKMRQWDKLNEFISGVSLYPETTLVLILDRIDIGKRVRNKLKSLPGAPVWETSYESWEAALRDYASAAMISCSPLTADPPDRSKPSPAQRWLALRMPITQSQTEYLWRRAGGSAMLARDVVRSLQLVGITDPSVMAYSQFTSYVDQVIGQHGADDFVELLLFGRRHEAFASVVEADLSRAEWSRVLGLLGQRLDWLGALHGALATREKLDQVMRRLQIPRHYILYYAHREDPKHNIARHFDTKRVSHCRMVVSRYDSILNASATVPAGFGESFITSWG